MNATRFAGDVLGVLRAHVERPVPLVITAARTSYPWPLHLGNSLWSIVAYRTVRDAMPADRRPGTIASIAVAFTTYAMAGGFAACYLMLGRPPAVLQSGTILPVYIALWAMVYACPFDLAFRALSQPAVLFVLGNLSEMDGYTTALNYMEEAFPLSSNSPVFPVLCGLSVMLAGALTRHFAAHGLDRGLARLDGAFRADALFYALLFGAYFYGALLPCAGDLACAKRTGFYEALPLFGVARNLAAEALNALAPVAASAPLVAVGAAKAKAD
ncbi:hypothetical protein KFE25_005680 [Diacronema lutheri]|uniref:Uncharacterized protein n=1 Tax=Diacronema lutheri TaxID=2081491 RepID=A0A8J5XED9_DIALT|nr:hypothetical protein KFE25_005680 [Diacronema lutheri]